MSQPAVEVRLPTPADLDYLAENLGSADRAELQACGYTDTRQALEHCWNNSKETFVGLIDGVPVALFGCAEHGLLLSAEGVPWLLGTDQMRTSRRVLQRMARRYIRVMLGRYQRLMNVVHCENTVAIEWLKRLGFRVSEDRRQYPNTGAEFFIFEMIRHV